MSAGHDHDHGHDHGRPRRSDLEDSPPVYHQLMTEAVASLLLAKGVIAPDELRAAIAWMDARSPALGARLVARAWRDPAFAERLQANTNAAAHELGIDAGTIPIRTVTNTADVHNVIVCTLCSCYPRGVLGLPPDWYKARAYRSRVVREPRAVLAEFGLVLPDSVELRVHDSTADLRYMVLPLPPEGSADLDEDALAALVTRDCLIGTALPTAPAAG